jgi:leucyl aminopeptidase
MPANRLGPVDLAAAAGRALEKTSAHTNVIEAAQLRERYPILHAVGCGSARPPAVFIASWRGSGAGDTAPLVSLCGKGVCFDTGGYDLKPPAGMLRMKKDKAGAAIALGLSRMIIEADLPIRLELRLGCVENMISGNALRPLDVVTTRHGLSVEVGNTDAEGRLVLCDLLAEACAARPDVLMDFATLTGAARVALGPDLPALFSNDDRLAVELFQAGNAVHDPVWRLPLWEGYNSWLDSSVADLNNVSEKLHAGAIVAALFLQRFVSAGTRWIHFDVYGWNDSAAPGRPAGGEVQAMRAAFSFITGLAGPVAPHAEQ